MAFTFACGSAKLSLLLAIVRGLDGAKRMQSLEERLEVGDFPTIAAVLGAETPTAIGLDQKQFDLIRRFAIERWAPQESAQVVALHDVKGRLNADVAAFATQFAKRMPKIETDPREDSLKALAGAA